MTTPTYIALGTVTLSAAGEIIQFNSIPSSYRDLVLVITGTMNISTYANVQFNGDANSNYEELYMTGYGTSTETNFATRTSVKGLIGTSAGSAVYEILEYSASDKHKTVLARSNRNADGVILSATRWTNTNPINSIKIYMDYAPSQFNSGFQFSLYGIAS